MKNKCYKDVKWGEYYIAIISLSEQNTKHKAIIMIEDVLENSILYTPISYSESSKKYWSSEVNYFELIEKLNIKVNDFILE